MENPQHESLPSGVPRFDSRALAQSISRINGGTSRTVKVIVAGAREEAKEYIDGLNEIRDVSMKSKGPRSKMKQDETQKGEKSPGRILAEAIAAVHGAVPISITGSKSNPVFANLIRKSQLARSVPPSRTFRSKQQNAA